MSALAAIAALTTAPAVPGPVDVTVITNAVCAGMLAKPPASHLDIFMKNIGGRDSVKPLKEQKQWNTWQHAFLSIAHAYNFKDMMNITYIPDP